MQFYEYFFNQREIHRKMVDQAETKKESSWSIWQKKN